MADKSIAHLLDQLSAAYSLENDCRTELEAFLAAHGDGPYGHPEETEEAVRLVVELGRAVEETKRTERDYNQAEKPPRQQEPGRSIL